MGIGVDLNVRGVLITDRTATSTVYTSLEEAIAAGETFIQGTLQAVTPMADLLTGRLAPDVPGGLQMKRTMVVLPATPVPFPEPAAGPPPPPHEYGRLTSGGNYLTSGGNYLVT